MPDKQFSNTAFPYRAATFGIFSSGAFLGSMCVGLVTVFGFFVIWPSVDLAVSHLFYDPGQCGDPALCGGFPGAENSRLAALRAVFYAMPYTVLGTILLFNAITFVRYKIPFRRDAKVIATLFASLVLGPGLIVNGVLKEFIQRHRPRDVVDFGGDFAFTPAGQWEGMCQGNCSFVSGEAALAPFMVLGILLLPKSWQKPALFVLLPVSFAMAFLRVVVGAHFISDAMLGYGLSVLIFSIMAYAVTRISRPDQAVNQTQL